MGMVCSYPVTDVWMNEQTHEQTQVAKRQDTSDFCRDNTGELMTVIHCFSGQDEFECSVLGTRKLNLNFFLQQTALLWVVIYPFFLRSSVCFRLPMYQCTNNHGSGPAFSNSVDHISLSDRSRKLWYQMYPLCSNLWHSSHGWANWPQVFRYWTDVSPVLPGLMDVKPKRPWKGITVSIFFKVPKLLCCNWMFVSSGYF